MFLQGFTCCLQLGFGGIFSNFNRTFFSAGVSNFSSDLRFLDAAFCGAQMSSSSSTPPPEASPWKTPRPSLSRRPPFTWPSMMPRSSLLKPFLLNAALFHDVAAGPLLVLVDFFDDRDPLQSFVVSPNASGLLAALPFLAQ